MAEEQVLKKEDNLSYRIGLWNVHKGTLVLTKNDIHFLSKKRGSGEVLRVPLSNIISVNTEKLDVVDYLFVVYKEAGAEHSAKFVHRDKRQMLFASASPSHFLSWEQAINDARFGRFTGNSNALDDLEKLAALKDKGILTDEEFAAKKKELLGL